jgi:hypothetical protein
MITFATSGGNLMRKYSKGAHVLPPETSGPKRVSKGRLHQKASEQLLWDVPLKKKDKVKKIRILPGSKYGR